MKKYYEKTKRTILSLVVLLVIVAFFFTFRSQFKELFTLAWNLTIGISNNVCTPQDRFEYLLQHPDEMRIAMVGNWEQLQREGNPRQQIIQASIREVNDAGGILGRRVFPHWIDTKESLDKLQETIEEISRDPSYYALIGPYPSESLAAVKQQLLNSKILTFAPAISNVNSSKQGNDPCIFFPNASDADDVEAIAQWAKNNKLGRFFLIAENKFFGLAFSQILEIMFFEEKLDICGRYYFPGKKIRRIFEHTLQNTSDYFQFENVIFINPSQDPLYHQLILQTLKMKKGFFFFYRPPNGDFSEEQLQRMFTICYFKNNALWLAFVSRLPDIRNIENDNFAAAEYQTIFILAEACRQAKTLHQEDIIQTLKTQSFKTPLNAEFRFGQNCFEASPKHHIVSISELRKIRERIVPQKKTDQK